MPSCTQLRLLASCSAALQLATNFDSVACSFKILSARGFEFHGTSFGARVPVPLERFAMSTVNPTEARGRPVGKTHVQRVKRAASAVGEDCPSTHQHHRRCHWHWHNIMHGEPSKIQYSSTSRCCMLRSARAPHLTSNHSYFFAR